jgi:hypothetical protein
MNAAVLDLGANAPIIAPASAPDPGFSTMPLITAAPLAGHSWEQTVLPARWRGRLLNLCNRAPAMKADQVVCIHDANVFVVRKATGLRSARLTVHFSAFSLVILIESRRFQPLLPARSPDTCRCVLQT